MIILLFEFVENFIEIDIFGDGLNFYDRFSKKMSIVLISECSKKLAQGDYIFSEGINVVENV